MYTNIDMTKCRYKKHINMCECEELSNNTEVLNTILDTINDGILAIDGSGKIIFLNNRFREMWKIADDLFPGMHSKELSSIAKLQLKNPDKFITKWRKLYYSTKEAIDTIESNDGKIYQVLTRPLMIDFSIKGRVWNFRDITLSKQKEKELNEKIEFQHMFINALPNPAFIKDKSEKYIDCNSAYEKFLGLNKEQIIGKSVYDIFPKELANRYSKMDNILFKNKGTQTYEHSMPHADGTTHEVFFNKAVITDCNGDVTGLVGVFSDITEKKKMQKALIESEERYRNLFENSPYAIIVHIEGNIVFANKNALRLGGFTRFDELIGRKIFDFIHPGYRNIVSKRVELVQKHKKTVPPIEEKFIKADGTIIDVEVIATYFQYGEKIASQVFIRDITSQKKEEKLRKLTENKLQEAIQHNKLITEFFANISHEFKTPLNIILGTFQLLTINFQEFHHGIEYSGFYRKIKIVQQNCYRLLRLVNNLIDITKIDSGYYKLNIYNYDIINVLENITLSVADYIQNRNIKLIFDTNVEEQMMAFDPDAMERIILNLLSNAVKFTKPGGNIKVTVKSENTKLIISVKDTGVGIPEEKKSIVFERFRQVDRLLTRNHEGSGIGLSLVKSLVEMQGGTIYIKSKKGIGTEFLLVFPITIIDKNDCTYSFNRDINSEDNNVEKINIEFSDIYY